MSDKDVERWVTEELRWDPKLDCNAIAVSANDGEVTLRGTVGSFREKRDAEKSAQRVNGVRTVTNELKVRLLTEHGRDDADLRGPFCAHSTSTASSRRRSTPASTTVGSPLPGRRHGSTSARRPATSPATFSVCSGSTTRSI
jgi:hypothetical protein